MVCCVGCGKYFDLPNDYKGIYICVSCIKIIRDYYWNKLRKILND